MKSLRMVLGILLILGIAFALLLIPEGRPKPPEKSDRTPFVWDRDRFWQNLEARFAAARKRDCDELRAEIDAAFLELEEHLGTLPALAPQPGDEAFHSLETALFHLAPLVASCTEAAPELGALITRLRETVKSVSRDWDFSSRPARDQVYRLRYGSRAAWEEVLLQLPQSLVPALTLGTDEPSGGPSAVHHGVRVASGDILVSRGGAPTSALIARGNDYPGNFSHIALLHIDERTSRATVIEALIEKGVILSSLEEYLESTKLRIMVLRARGDLPAVRADPLLPHRVAKRALEEARRRKIPYDFAMDYQDPELQFCSEVVSNSYSSLGIDLWEGLTSISSRGATSWLAALGVRYFETHGPSDLEYDPKLRVVAEWRDPETLYKDHVDNAVIDALLEGAEVGETLGHTWYLLPWIRLAKVYSAALNLFGRTGPVPQGMSSTVAARVKWLVARHARIEERTLELADDFLRERGYTAPYWQLVELARRAKNEIDRGEIDRGEIDRGEGEIDRGEGEIDRGEGEIDRG